MVICSYLESPAVRMHGWFLCSRATEPQWRQSAAGLASSLTPKEYDCRPLSSCSSLTKTQWQPSTHSDWIVLSWGDSQWVRNTECSKSRGWEAGMTSCRHPLWKFTVCRKAWWNQHFPFSTNWCACMFIFDNNTTGSSRDPTPADSDDTHWSASNIKTLKAFFKIGNFPNTFPALRFINTRAGNGLKTKNWV